MASHSLQHSWHSLDSDCACLRSEGSGLQMRRDYSFEQPKIALCEGFGIV